MSAGPICRPSDQLFNICLLLVLFFLSANILILVTVVKATSGAGAQLCVVHGKAGEGTLGPGYPLPPGGTPHPLSPPFQ
jgi:hypothetical protein